MCGFETCSVVRHSGLRSRRRARHPKSLQKQTRQESCVSEWETCEHYFSLRIVKKHQTLSLAAELPRSSSTVIKKPAIYESCLSRGLFSTVRSGLSNPINRGCISPLLIVETSDADLALWSFGPSARNESFIHMRSLIPLRGDSRAMKHR